MVAGRLRTGATLVVLAVAAYDAVQQPGATLDGVIGSVALHALVVGAAWWALATVALLLARLPGLSGRVAGRVADALTPALLRRLAAAAAGAAVVAAPAAPALAAPAFTLDTTATSTPAATVLDRLPAADWPAGTPAPATPRAAPELHSAPVVVLAGDTLWDIAARHLGPRATDEQIAREWPRWWRANAAVVGRDPDLLRPGQVLTPPPAAS